MIRFTTAPRITDVINSLSFFLGIKNCVLITFAIARKAQLGIKKSTDAFFAICACYIRRLFDFSRIPQRYITYPAFVHDLRPFVILHCSGSYDSSFFVVANISTAKSRRLSNTHGKIQLVCSCGVISDRSACDRSFCRTCFILRRALCYRSI